MSAASVALAALTGTSPAGFLDGNEANQWLGGLCLGLAGAAVLRAGTNRLGPLLAVAGLVTALAGTAQEWAVLAHRDGLPAAALAAWWASFAWLPGLVGTLLGVPLLFPDGRLPSARWRWPARAAVGALGGAVLMLVTTQEPLDDGGFAWARNPFDLPAPDGPQVAVALGLAGAALLAGLTATVRILVRLPRTVGPERTRAALFAVCILLGVAGFAVPWTGVALLLNIVSFATLTVAIVRYRLFGVETYLPRALAYAVCIAAIVAVYLLATTFTASRVGPGWLPAFVAAVVALASARALGRLDRLIRRLLFGDRDRPGDALAALGARLSEALDADDVLPASVARVCESLRLPYAEIRLDGEPGTGVAYGHRPAHTADLPLHHAGEDVGVLTVGLRPGERALAAADRRILTSFAHQVAVAAHGVRATRELRRSREQVVVARESERQRLHRDLHDGIGPALAGISLGLETAGRLVDRDPVGARRLIGELRDETRECVDELREVIADLRPATLDDAGLVGALTQRAEQLEAQSGGRLRLTVTGGIAGRPLPPAVEVAAYRIGAEALTNLARHSGASAGRVELTCGGPLRLLVCDNGSGATPAALGTGLASMRRRAEELGGTCTVTFRPGEGTTVLAELPLPATITPDARLAEDPHPADGPALTEEAAR